VAVTGITGNTYTLGDLTGNTTVTVSFVLINQPLPFSTYVLVKWDNTLMLDLVKLAAEGYYIEKDTKCTWYYKANTGNPTELGSGMSYSAGPKKGDYLKTDGVYYFVLSGSKGTFRSTEYTHVMQSKSATILAYPNPVLSGGVLTIVGVTEGTPVQVFNQAGMCVSNTLVTSDPFTLTLQVPAGLYLIRTTNGDIKIIVE
jgi:hypothetical protein